MKSYLLVLTALCILEKCSSYFINIDAHAEECFFERVVAGKKLGEIYCNVIDAHPEESFLFLRGWLLEKS